MDQGKIIKAAVPVAAGINNGRFVNEPCDHEPYWTTVQPTHEHLWDVEYYHVPRGALFRKVEYSFYAYLGEVLCTNPIRRMILPHFHVPRKHTIVRTDLHYTSDPDDLDRVFSQ